jgi:hypothetical protein
VTGVVRLNLNLDYTFVGDLDENPTSSLGPSHVYVESEEGLITYVAGCSERLLYFKPVKEVNEIEEEIRYVFADHVWSFVRRFVCRESYLYGISNRQ